MKTVLLGALGQLGRELGSILPGDVVSLSRSDADLTEPNTLETVLKKHQPDVVINCAAYNFVDKAEAEPQAAFQVNAWALRELARLCSSLNTVLVHFSTDYVFGLAENRLTPYEETEAPGPVSVYGLSKLSGEYFVRAGCARHFVVRTCGLYGLWGAGGKGGNFVETMLRLAGQGKPLRIVADQVCTPSFCGDVAQAVAQLIKTNRYGLYHLTNRGQCSWHEFARAIFEIEHIDANPIAISSQEFGAAARRPPYSVLSTEKLARLGLESMRPWREALHAYLGQRRERISSSSAERIT